MSSKANFSRRATRKAAAEQAAARDSGKSFIPKPRHREASEEASKPTRVAAYIRISTDEEHQPFSLEAQEARLLAYISSQPGWEFTGFIYKDEKSGATLDRPGLQRALTAANSGKFDVLLVYRVDRLSRSLRGLVDILDQLSKADVAFRSATEPVDTSSAVGRMLVQMLGVFAQFEREILIDRVTNALKRKATKGEWCGGRVPHGYELDRDSKKLAIAAGEAHHHVKAAFEIFTKKHLGSKEVAKELNNRGYRTRTRKPFSGHTVLSILRNRTYIGEVYYRGTWYRVDDHHAAVIDSKLFDQAQKILDQRADDYGLRPAANSDYALSSGIKCKLCGGAYVGTSATGRSARYRYYTCITRARYGPKSCPAERLPAEEVEAKMLATLIDVYQQTDLIYEAVSSIAASAAQAHDDNRRQVAAADRDLADIADKINRYHDAFEKGTMAEAVSGQRVAQLQERARQIRAHREELLESAPIDPAAYQIDPSELGHMQDEIFKLLQDGAPGVKNALFPSLVHEIQVTGRHHIKPYFRVPENSRTPDSTSGVRILQPWAPPAQQNAKSVPVIEGPTITLSPTGTRRRHGRS